ncbi:beta-N-acetylhexosaminidase [Streptomyces ferrugineus]|uniref:Beta-N-acetylhexosaminidase n=1 Tax=Streptomyces ferrugineus TaxID=1413221 RepID=A0A7M2SCN2_9ACTN|nr:beta-N-acetylhexosaminidase [Streptomyces ferrugineus]QOV33153.1 beta-N-acetylhexosaminidase [Streptomyces ferrugineus]
MHEKKLTPITRRTFVGAAAVLGGLAVTPLATTPAQASAPDATADPSRPQTIPALREWHGQSGSYRLGPAGQIIVRSKDARRLSGVAQTFAADLQADSKDVGRVSVTDRPAHKCDIVLQLGSTDPELGAEGYLLEVGDHITVTARTAKGAFYGTRTLLQLFRQESDIPAGVARDWPRYAERGLMVDIARMHFSYEWLADRIRDMAYLKLNLLHLHFTDDEGWRIESRLGVQSTPSLTKQQVRDLLALAARYHVTVVPEIDMPAHTGALLAHYPQYQLRDAAGVAAHGKIDYSIPGARRLLREVVSEYLELFPGPYWHMGADEYIVTAEYANYPQLVAYAQQRFGPQAIGKDGVRGLVNDMHDLVREQGRTMRVWNDLFSQEGVVTLDKDLVVDWWTDLFYPQQPISPDPPQTLLAAGYRINNRGFFPTYDFPQGPPAQPSMPWTYENWAVDSFHGYAYGGDHPTSGFHTVDPNAPANRGSAINLWNSGGSWTESEAAESIYPRLRVMAQKTWESPVLVTGYDGFQSVIAAVGAAPGN